MSALVLGAGMGVAIAAPVGPIAALCIERTFARGARAGIATAIGAGFADAGFGVIAALGIGLVTRWVLAHERHLRVLSAVILTALAVSAWRRRKSLIVSKDGAAARPIVLVGAFTSGFALAASSPVTIVTFAVALVTFGADVIRSGDRVDHICIPLGVLVGSAGWYAGLTCAAWIARERLGARALAHVGTASAIFLAGCALFSAVLAMTSKS